MRPRNLLNHFLQCSQLLWWERLSEADKWTECFLLRAVPAGFPCTHAHTHTCSQNKAWDYIYTYVNHHCSALGGRTHKKLKLTVHIVDERGGWMLDSAVWLRLRNRFWCFSFTFFCHIFMFSTGWSVILSCNHILKFQSCWITLQFVSFTITFQQNKWLIPVILRWYKGFSLTHL